MSLILSAVAAFSLIAADGPAAPPYPARFGPTTQPPQAGSDLGHVVGLITRAGYVLPPHMMNVRFIRLLDDPNNSGIGRREMLLFYNEDMGPTGLTTMDLIDGDGGPTSRINERWLSIEQALIARAAARFTVEAMPAR